MFEELKTKLGSIDSALNEESLNLANQSGDGIEALKKSGNEFKYLLLEVRLKEGGNEFAKLFLRGFDYPMYAHPIIAEYFLRNEVTPSLTSNFKMPDRWPLKDKSFDQYERTVKSESEGLELTIFAVGGGKFDLKNNGINLRGYSQAFGSIPRDYQERFKELLQQLVQKPTYNGFQINFEK
ncbi:hypothetical protein HYW20_07190 [Candidatus Woesearchaeota archaeon]|nr:hypothetical protein [Candidatus Woesearchaeota archaeon]